MPIIVKLDEIIKKKNITSKELCEMVGITEANMSILRSGRAKAIRFSTLTKLCYYLECQPSDILEFDGILGEEENEK